MYIYYILLLLFIIIIIRGNQCVQIENCNLQINFVDDDVDATFAVMAKQHLNVYM